MPSFFASSAILAYTLISAVRAYGPGYQTAGQNVAVYWGQGPNQKSLGSFCADNTIDIIPIGFVNVFPDQNGTYGYPGTNFGNACGGYYVDSKNETTKLLGSCPQIGADITYCQSQGKKILLSLGGGSTGVFVASDDSAKSFAEFLYSAFGPVSPSWQGPRPFGNASVDGFDFDIEASANAIPTALGYGYATMVNHLRTLGTMMITASPQCIVPDANLGNALASAPFDAVFVQFYNTPQCSARAYFDNTYGAYGGPATDISYDSWISWMQANSSNPHALVYLGLPASPDATFGEMYLNTTEAQEILTHFQSKYPAQFGGAMIWEATLSDNNQVNGMSYAANVKCFLTGSCGGISTTTSSSSSIPTFPPTGTGSGYPTGSPTAAQTTTSATNTTPTGTYSYVPTVTTTDGSGVTYTYTPTQDWGTSTSPAVTTNSVITTTDRHGNTLTYTSTNVQPTASFPSLSTWPDWDPSSSTVSPTSTSSSSSSTSWGEWDPTTTASSSSTSASSLGWTWHFSSTSISSSTKTYETTITASDAKTVTIMPLPATSSSSHASIASWSSYWTQRAPFSSSSSITTSTSSSTGWSYPSSSTAAAAASSSGWQSTNWATVTAAGAATSSAGWTSAGAVGASTSPSPSISVYVQPGQVGTFTGSGSVSRPVFGLVAGVIVGIVAMLW